MTFFNLSALFFLLVAPPVVALYFLKLRRREVRVSSNLFWRKALQDLHANSPFQRLRKNLLLFLQLLFILIAVAGLADPVIRGSGLKSRLTLVLLDASASMKSSDVEPSRFDRAKIITESLISEISNDERIALILFHSRAELLAGPTSNKSLLLHQLEKATSTDASTSITDALALASSVLEKETEAEIIVVTDGAFEIELAGQTLEKQPSAGIRFLRVGERGDNAGITQVATRPSPDEPGTDRLLITVQNFDPVGAAPRNVALSIHEEGRLLRAKQLVLAPGQSIDSSFALTPVDTGRFEITISSAGRNDYLKTDDRAFLHRPPRRSTKSLLITEGNVFLERALAANDDLSVTTILPGNFPRGVGESEPFDLFFHDYDGPTAEKLPPGGHFFFHAAPPTEAVRMTPAVDGVVILDWSITHPVTRFVDFDDLVIANVSPLELGPTATPLLVTDKGVAIAAFSEPERFLRGVVTGFSLRDTNWPLKLSFPLVLANAHRWLVDSSQDSNPATTSSIIRFRARSEQEVWARRPDGNSVRAPAGEDSWASFEVLQCGWWASETDEGAEEIFAVNLSSPEESRILPRDVVRIGGYSVVGSSVEHPIHRRLWKTFAWIALALVLLEWIVYHRRVALSLVLATAALASSNHAAAQADEGMTPGTAPLQFSRLSPEFPGPFRQGRTTSFPLLITTGAQPFQGQVILQSFFVAPSNVDFRHPFELGPNTSRVIWPTFRPSGTELLVEIADRSGDVVSRHRFSEPTSRSGVHVLVLGELEQFRATCAGVKTPITGSTSMWDLSSPTTDRPMICGLPASEFPDNGLALQFIDCIVIAGADLQAIPEESTRIIESFVLAGGHLIVSHPEGYPGQPLSKKWDFLPIRIAGSTVIEDLSALGALEPPEPVRVSPSNKTGFPKQSYSAAEIEVAGDTLARSGNSPLVVERIHGLGTITFLNFDVTRPPFQGASATPNFLGWLLNPRSPFRFTHRVFDAWVLTELRDLSPHQRISPGALIAFLVGYFLVLGPINAFLLFRRKRKELAAFTIPIISLIFLGFAYLFGFVSHGTQPTIVKQEIAFLPRNEGPTRTEGFLSLHSPGLVSYDVAPASRGGTAGIFYPFGHSQDVLQTQVWADDSIELRNIQMVMWSQRFFRTSTVHSTGTLDMRVSRDSKTGAYTLEVDNELGALRNARISIPDSGSIELSWIPTGTSTFRDLVPKQEKHSPTHQYWAAKGIRWTPDRSNPVLFSATLEEELDPILLNRAPVTSPSRVLILKEMIPIDVEAEDEDEDE